MNIRTLTLLTIISIFISSCDLGDQNQLPKGFIYIEGTIPNIDLDMKYYSEDNFVGQKVKGYIAPVCICTKEAAFALKNVQEELNKKNLSLRVFDAYRPQTAVNHFVEWAKNIDDTLTKAKFYPQVKKKDLFKLNYIASKSSHSRGSTFDLTIIDSDGKAIDMGTPFDFFGPKSWPESNEVTAEQKKNRLYLQKIMMKHGFKPYQEEWWHFTLLKEPYPETYFDFWVQ